MNVDGYDINVLSVFGLEHMLFFNAKDPEIIIRAGPHTLHYDPSKGGDIAYLETLTQTQQQFLDAAPGLFIKPNPADPAIQLWRHHSAIVEATLQDSASIMTKYLDERSVSPLGISLLEQGRAQLQALRHLYAELATRPHSRTVN